MSRLSHPSAAFIPAMVAAVAILSSGLALADEKHPILPLMEGNQWTYIDESEINEPKVMDVRVAEHLEQHNWRLARVENYMFPLAGADVFFFADKCARTCELNPRLLHDPLKTSPTETVSCPWYCCQEGAPWDTSSPSPTSAWIASTAHAVV